MDYAFTHIPAYAPRSGGQVRTYQNQSTHYYWVVLPSTGSTVRCRADTEHRPSAVVRPAPGRPDAGLSRERCHGQREPTFTWNPIAGARQYELMVSTDPGFGASGAVEDITTSYTSYTGFDKGYPTDDLYWQVRAIDYSGKVQPWSTSRCTTRLGRRQT